MSLSVSRWDSFRPLLSGFFFFPSGPDQTETVLVLWVRHLDRKAARLDGQKKQVSCVYGQVSVKRVSNNLLPLEVREEILGTQVNDKRSEGPRLVEGIVNEKTTCSEMKDRDKESRRDYYIYI